MSLELMAFVYLALMLASLLIWGYAVLSEPPFPRYESRLRTVGRFLLGLLSVLMLALMVGLLLALTVPAQWFGVKG